MKTSTKFNLFIGIIVISYFLIAVRGEHLGGPLILFMFMNLFSKELVYGLIPTLGIILLMATMVVNRKIIFYVVSMLCLYLCLILYIISLIKDNGSNNEQTSILSMIPFVIFSITGFFILKSKK